jgi:hypothetical protein
MNGNHNNAVGTVTGHRLSNHGVDSAQIVGQSYEGFVYTGAVGSSTASAVKGFWRPVTNETICNDGAKSGERCGKSGPRDHCVVRTIDGASLWTCHVSDVTSTTYVNQFGDSGGPVIKRNPDGVYAVGTVVGGANQESTGYFKTMHYHELPWVMPADSYLLTR